MFDEALNLKIYTLLEVSEIEARGSSISGPMIRIHATSAPKGESTEVEGVDHLRLISEKLSTVPSYELLQTPTTAVYQGHTFATISYKLGETTPFHAYAVTNVGNFEVGFELSANSLKDLAALQKTLTSVNIEDGM
jgi:hypothetical protein